METVTIEVKSETAHRWREIAAREGRALEAIAAAAAEAGTDALERNDGAREYSQPATTQAKSIAESKAVRGSKSRGLWAGLPGSVDEFLRERRECDGL